MPGVLEDQLSPASSASGSNERLVSSFSAPSLSVSLSLSCASVAGFHEPIAPSQSQCGTRAKIAPSSVLLETTIGPLPPDIE